MEEGDEGVLLGALFPYWVAVEHDFLLQQVHLQKRWTSSRREDSRHKVGEDGRGREAVGMVDATVWSAGSDAMIACGV